MTMPSFLNHLQDKKQLDEAFNSAPYELTFGKKGAGDVFFTFVDEDEKEYRIQFYTPQGLGKNVRQVFIGQKRGSTYPDAIAKFKNPMRVIASMIEATKQFLATPIGKSTDGFAVNFSKKALDRGMTLIPKIIRQSGLKQKLNVMDLTYAPVPDRGYVWLLKKGKDPAQVFDGPKMQGITWDDPDKVGDVPVQNDTSDFGSTSDQGDGRYQKDTSGPTISTKALKIPSNAEVRDENADGFSVHWKGINFPKSGKYAGAFLKTKILYNTRTEKANVSTSVVANGRTLTTPKMYQVGLDLTSIQSTLTRWGEDMEMVARNMQTLNSSSYNPKQVFLDEIVVDDHGGVKWRGYDMGDRRTTETMLTQISKETERLEKENPTPKPTSFATPSKPTPGKKTGAELATYAGSIRDNVPNSRDLDWQVYATKDGQTVNVEWSITYRRNTAVGAFREYKSQIDRANRYLQDVQQDAKQKGYNVSVPNLMTMDRAQRSDEWAEGNGESAYSEYEQAIGGGMQVSIAAVSQPSAPAATPKRSPAAKPAAKSGLTGKGAASIAKVNKLIDSTPDVFPGLPGAGFLSLSKEWERMSGYVRIDKARKLIYFLSDNDEVLAVIGAPADMNSTGLKDGTKVTNVEVAQSRGTTVKAIFEPRVLGPNTYALYSPTARTYALYYGAAAAKAKPTAQGFDALKADLASKYKGVTIGKTNWYLQDNGSEFTLGFNIQWEGWGSPIDAYQKNLTAVTNANNILRDVEKSAEAAGFTVALIEPMTRTRAIGNDQIGYVADLNGKIVVRK